MSTTVGATACFADFHKDQICEWGGMGQFPCHFNLGRNQLKPVPDACSAQDREEMEKWDAQPAYCMRGGAGNCSITWSDPAQCAAPHH